MIELILGKYRTVTDWKCYTAKGWTLSTPKPKTKYIDIPGSDGKLDLTSVLTGIVNYEDREFKATLFSPYHRSTEEKNTLKNTIINSVHGQKLKLILTDSPSYYINGRVLVEDFDVSKLYPTFIISAICEPWRYKNTLTTVKKTINGTQNVSLINEKKPALITIDTNAALTVKFEGKTVSVPAGKTEVLDFILKEGANELSITGTNAVTTITYQEASL